MAQLARSTIFMAALIAAPAIAAALGLSAIEGYRFVRPQSPLFGDLPAASLSEAITRGLGVEQAYVFIRAGQDPNQLIVVDDPDYSGSRPISVSPLMLAVAARDYNVVLMLLSFGGRLDLPQNRWAGCLALDLGDEAIANIVAREDGPGSSPTCRDRRSDAAFPLLRWVD